MGVGKLGNCTWKTVLAGMVSVRVICIFLFRTTVLVEIVVAPKMMIALKPILFKLSNSRGRSMKRCEPVGILTEQVI